MDEAEIPYNDPGLRKSGAAAGTEMYRRLSPEVMDQAMEETFGGE